MSALEKAARALPGGENCEPYRAQVRVVLRAIRVPDERVLEAMREALWRVLEGGTPMPSDDEMALAVWQAGIDAMTEEWK